MSDTTSEWKATITVSEPGKRDVVIDVFPNSGELHIYESPDYWSSYITVSIGALKEIGVRVDEIMQRFKGSEQ